MRRRTFFRIALVAAAIFAIVMALSPNPPIPDGILDKWQHMSAFGTLTLLAVLGYPETPLHRIGERLSFLGALVEVFQSIPALHRDCDVMDWLADTYVIVCVLIVARILRGPAPGRTPPCVIDEFPLRTWLAGAIAAATVAVVLILSGDVQATLAALAGAVSLVVIIATAHEEPAPGNDEPVVAEEGAPLDTALDAIADPVLVVRGGRVAVANGPARRLLGAHIVGEDARVAIRHPGAAEYLAERGGGDTARPVDLVGIGTLDQRWQMRASSIAPDTRLVHLIDKTGQYAAERMRVDFVANASHELRTPLASILGYVETLADAAGEDPALRQRFLGIVFDEARRMERLVEDLMSLSRIEAEKFRLPRAEVDLTAIAIEVGETLGRTRGERGHDITVDIAPDVPRVTGDEAQLSQLLHNLVGNAMKYGRAGTPVAVSVTRDGGNVRLRVADRGDGIAPEHLPRLTERFYRVDAGRSRSLGGTGLGLAIVKHIVERHRGRLDIESAVGEGTRVSVTLPAALQPEPPPPAMS